MRWRRAERSANLEDRRGEGVPGGGRYGAGARLGLGGVIILLVVSLITGQDFLTLLDQGPESPLPGETPTPRQTSPEEEKLVDFVSFVLDDVQGTWHTGFPQGGKRYRDARLVLFTDAVRSNCGFAESAIGTLLLPARSEGLHRPGILPRSQTTLRRPGDFAQAYVIAHEIGHHVQHLLGIDAEVRRVQGSQPERAAALSVRLELQADCLAGVWGNATRQRGILEQGDVEEALGAAAAIGDDRIRRQSGGSVNPETWTHGSSEQRVAWFRRGFQSGRMQACETFSERLAEDG
jgi:uncharacterized protein